MPKYKVSYSGFEYVEADNETEAEELFHDGASVYEEEQIDSIEEVDDFTIDI